MSDTTALEAIHESEVQSLRAPDAGLLLLLAELPADHERLLADHKRLRADLDALTVLIEGET